MLVVETRNQRRTRGSPLKFNYVIFKYITNSLNIRNDQLKPLPVSPHRSTVMKSARG